MFRLLAPLALVAASVWGFTAISALAVSRTSRGTAVGPVRPGPVTSAASARPFRPGVVIVGFRRGVSAHRQHLIAAQAGGSASRIAAPGIRLIRVRRGQENKALRRLGRHASSLRFAELDYLMHQTAAAVFPNDPSFGLQWAFQNTGQSVNATTGTSGADENPGSAWSMATGSRSVVIAETDTGVDYNHPDLAANIWSNPGGIGGCDAGTHGYNVLTTTCNPMDDETSYGGHGTHVAGILGAQGNNGTGVTGVNWTTSILPVKWLDSSGSGSTSSLISALNWVLQAKQAGVNVRVVNDSATFVGTAYSQALSDEIDTLGAHDILFVTAAGNTGDNNDDPAVRRYPCGYDRPTEICATASDQYDQKPHWANYGATTVDLAAPGANVYSTLRNGSYGYISGGSMASPQGGGHSGPRPVARLYVGSQPARRHPQQRRSASVPQWTRPHRRAPGRVQGPSGMLEFPATAARSRSRAAARSRARAAARSRARAAARHRALSAGLRVRVSSAGGACTDLLGFRARLGGWHHGRHADLWPGLGAL